MAPGLLGNLVLLLAFAMVVIGGTAFLLTALGKKNLFNLGAKVYYLQVFFAAAALAYLFYLFFTHNFGIRYVAEYSSTDLPFHYLLSSLWGGQEGTYLLWFFLSTMFGLFILKRGRQYTSWAMFFHALVHTFLLSIMVFALSPFRALIPPALEGSGLNPLLQDYWMVIHPPIMFCSFAMAGVPFALALAAMVKRDFSNWIKTTLPFVAITSFGLILANVLGGYWAYKTLGWGGYWAWDPVENTSFIPWVTSIGLIHGMLIERRSGALRRFNLLLSTSLFLLIVYGTFLTRSGVLADFSVHSFVDLGINGILVGFLLGYVLLTLGAFFFSRTPDRIGRPLNYNIFSRDFILFTGMVLFLILGAVVLFWSSLPLITRYLTANPSAADVGTYNAFAFPFAIIISLFLTFSPLFIGPGFKMEKMRMKSLLSFGISLVVAAVLFLLKAIPLTIAITSFIYLGVMILYFLTKTVTKPLLQALMVGLVGVAVALIFGVRQLEYLIFIGAALTAAGAHINIIVQYLTSRPELVGGYLAHFGFGLMLVGILTSSAFSVNHQVVIPRNQEQQAFDYDITYNGTAGDIRQKDNEILLTLDHNGKKIEARPQFFYAERMDGMMKKPYINKSILYDLYFSPQDIQEMPGSQGLVLHKGESAKVGDFNIKFVNFDMTSHESATGGITVGATLEVEHNGQTETITPHLVSDPNAGGDTRNMISEPAPLFSGQNYEVHLERVNASEGAVGLSIPGLVESGAPDRLILDVSRKPAINVLWFGTMLIFFGMLITIYSRFKK
ncbi:putative Cytochrome c assembly protein [Candidatus Zixiibacteriota bacterium]|nr:putative Cytochrome c assembly protein [candidate division Zixibacteria bacterium]